MIDLGRSSRTQAGYDYYFKLEKLQIARGTMALSKKVQLAR